MVRLDTQAPTKITRRALFPLLAFPMFAAARKKRKDCFFGLHFDLHPNDKDTALGRDLTPQMIDGLLRRTRPDYLQYDCKGHIGYMGYPSKVSTPASNIIKDSLALWRKGTADAGVGLFIHFSGVWDSLAIKQHPEWAALKADGTRDENATSVFGKYVDERMIPQLKEAVSTYDLDGAWVDGECWALRLDYGQAAAEGFRAKTGIATLPKKSGEPGWQEFLDFQRDAFRRYLKHYLDELHRFRPQFQIASNWLYTTFVPEKPDLPVDFISGDYLGNASISTARLEARYLSAVEQPWDLMAWGFQNPSQAKVGLSHKTAAQLQQEAAVVLAQGGGFQIYYQPTRAGWMDEKLVGVMEKVARFCREREAVSHQTRPVPDIGVLFSKTSLYRTANKLFGGWGSNTDPARGVVDALVDSQLTVDVIPEWRLSESAATYPLIVVPDWPAIGTQVRDELVRYAESGGTLLLIGAENAALFARWLKVNFSAEAKDQTAFVAGDEIFGNVRGVWQSVTAGAAQTLGMRYPTYDERQDGQIAATVNALGKGKVAAIYGPLGKVYTATHSIATRQFLQHVVKAVHRPKLDVTAPSPIEVALRKKGARTLVHLVNTAGMQVAGDYAVTDYVPPVGPVIVKLAIPKQPRQVSWHPGGQVVKGAWRDGVWTGQVDRVDIHGVLVLEG